MLDCHSCTALLTYIILICSSKKRQKQLSRADRGSMSYPASQCDSPGDLKYAGDDDSLAHGEGTAANRGPKAAQHARLHAASGEGKVYNSGDSGTALMNTALPVGHIIGADAEGKSIGEHCGASKDYGQLCGHLHNHHELSRYTLYKALASIVFAAYPSVWTIWWPVLTGKSK